MGMIVCLGKGHWKCGWILKTQTSLIDTLVHGILLDICRWSCRDYLIIHWNWIKALTVQQQNALVILLDMPNSCASNFTLKSKFYIMSRPMSFCWSNVQAWLCWTGVLHDLFPICLTQICTVVFHANTKHFVIRCVNGTHVSRWTRCNKTQFFLVMTQLLFQWSSPTKRGHLLWLVETAKSNVEMLSAVDIYHCTWTNGLQHGCQRAHYITLKPH